MSAHPIGRLGVPDDIAKGIVFLASDDSAFMTGAGLVIDGAVSAAGRSQCLGIAARRRFFHAGQRVIVVCF